MVYRSSQRLWQKYRNIYYHKPSSKSRSFNIGQTQIPWECELEKQCFLKGGKISRDQKLNVKLLSVLWLCSEFQILCVQWQGVCMHLRGSWQQFNLCKCELKVNLHISQILPAEQLCSLRKMAECILSCVKAVFRQQLVLN